MHVLPLDGGKGGSADASEEMGLDGARPSRTYKGRRKKAEGRSRGSGIGEIVRRIGQMLNAEG
jgi:hypothetical protein